jgi:hypothetical protein
MFGPIVRLSKLDVRSQPVTTQKTASTVKTNSSQIFLMPPCSQALEVLGQEDGKMAGDPEFALSPNNYGRIRLAVFVASATLVSRSPCALSRVWRLERTAESAWVDFVEGVTPFLLNFTRLRRCFVRDDDHLTPVLSLGSPCATSVPRKSNLHKVYQFRDTNTSQKSKIVMAN